MPRMVNYGPPRSGLETSCLDWLREQPEHKTYKPVQISRGIGHRRIDSITSALSSLYAKGFVDRPETGYYRAIPGAKPRPAPGYHSVPEISTPNGSYLIAEYRKPVSVTEFSDKIIIITTEGNVQEIRK